MRDGEPRVLLLWDVDHTLTDNGGVSSATYADAFELLTGPRPEVTARTGGRTDVEIIETLLADNGKDPSGYTPAERFETLARAGARNMSELRRRGHALPGAAESLARLQLEEGVHQSALTGNIEQNARSKLAAFDLDPWVDFSVGAFGSESRVRADLPRVAQHKARESFGFDPDRDVTILVGDTTRDVQAGLDGGARVLAVDTGGVPAQELLDAGADVALEGLADVDAVVAAVDELRRPGPATGRSSAGS